MAISTFQRFVSRCRIKHGQFAIICIHILLTMQLVSDYHIRRCHPEDCFCQLFLRNVALRAKYSTEESSGPEESLESNLGLECQHECSNLRIRTDFPSKGGLFIQIRRIWETFIRNWED